MNLAALALAVGLALPAEPQKPIGLPDPTAAAETSAATPVAAILLFSLAAAAALYARAKKGAPSASTAMAIVASESLGGRNRLVLVEVRGRELLLAVGDRGATLITELLAEAPVAEPEVKSQSLAGLLALRRRSEVFAAELEEAKRS